MTPPNSTGPWVDVRDFAPPNYPADGLGGHPWDVYIQLAIDYVIQQTINSLPPGSVGTLYLPPGKYYLANPVQVRFIAGNAYQYCSIQIIGDAPPFGADTFHGSVLIAGFPDKPALIIQSVRQVRIADLGIHGKNNWTVANSPNPRLDFLLDDAKFLVSGVTDNLVHAPYAGICIDPFASPAPTAGSPPVYAGYPGMDSSYLAASGSSSVTIERCYIDNFVVGICISPNGVTQNAESIFINDCNIQGTKSAIAICQDQSRGVFVQNAIIGGAKYAFDGISYGRGHGPCPSIFGAQLGTLKHIFNFKAAFGAAALNGIYCEFTLGLGALGSNYGYDGYSFNGCAFNLTSLYNKPSVFYHFANMGMTTFNACVFDLIGYDPLHPTLVIAPPPGPLYIFNAGFMSFNDCRIGPLQGVDDSPPWIESHPERVLFHNTMVAGSRGIPVMFSQINPVDYVSNIVSAPMLPGSMFFPLRDIDYDLYNAGLSQAPRWVASKGRLIVVGTGASLSLSSTDGTATFTVTGGLVLPGDLIRVTHLYSDFIEGHTGISVYPVIGRVTQVMSGTASVSWVPDYVLANPPATSAYLEVVGYERFHTNTKGDVVATTSVITNVTNPGAWAVNDRIRDINNTHIPVNTYVTAVSGTTITLSNPVTGTATGIQLFEAEVRSFTSTQAF